MFPHQQRREPAKPLRRLGGPTDWPTRPLVQALSLRPMKKLTGEIGASRALQAFLKEQAFACDVPVHLQGHSLGCKVMLEAVRVHEESRAAGAPHPQSLTLIQAAVSRWCFSERVVQLPTVSSLSSASFAADLACVATAARRQATPGFYHGIPEAIETPVLVLYRCVVR